MGIDEFNAKVNFFGEEYLEKVLRFAMENLLYSHEEIAVMLLDEKNYQDLDPGLLKEIQDPKRWPVILIEGRRMRDEGEENRYFEGKGSCVTFRPNGGLTAIDLAVGYIKGLKKEKEREWMHLINRKVDRNSGWKDCPTHLIGIVEMGYEVMKSGCLPDRLAISLVQLYYIK